MKYYRIMIINSDFAISDTRKFYSLLSGSSGAGLEISRDNKLPISLSIAKIQSMKLDWTVYLFSKPSNLSIERTIPAFFETVASSKYISEFIGYIILINAQYRYLDEVKYWDIQKPAQAEYYTVNRAKKQIAKLREIDPIYPMVIATYNHYLDGALEFEKMLEELELFKDESIIQIDLDNKEKALQAIYKLFDINDISFE